MKDRTRQAIVDALEHFVDVGCAVGSRRLTVVNLSRESGVSKATLYRYLERDDELRARYEELRRSRFKSSDSVSLDGEQSEEGLTAEVRRLRSELADVKRDFHNSSKIKSHQIFLLWSENKRLKAEIARMSQHRVGKVIPITPDVES